MIREKHILTDVDGVLLNWNDSFSTFMAEHGHPLDEGMLHSYTISDRHSVDSQTAISLIKDFNEGPYMESLKPLPDSVEYVRKLHELGFRFTCVTSLSDNPQAKVYRAKNLLDVFGPVFSELVCLKMGANKKQELSRWVDSGYFWIEDHPEQAEAGVSVGLRPILIQHPYNAEYHSNKQFRTVPLENAWRDIYDMVIADYT